MKLSESSFQGNPHLKMPAVAKAKSARAQQVFEVFASDYLSYQYQFVEFLVEHLVDMSREFKGDLQLMMMLAILGQVKIRAVHGALQAGEAASTAVLLTPGITASRLSDITFIPRQTVRRKLLELERMGWARKKADHSWCLAVKDGATSVRNDLAQVDGRAMARISRLYAELEEIVDRKRPGAQIEQGSGGR